MTEPWDQLKPLWYRTICNQKNKKISSGRNLRVSTKRDARTGYISGHPTQD
ncbi:hypothetical protein BIFGAL_04174 [Bifidobacterium gallicum DSM 20093 = LMG 11596]|uniref:Uncharacterized protein n=1 Tax=Bifidobacterium gallicum DSM 20093 = LMG 11596 TaxID=561180 RepID=D1NWC4_9BIFI|nr:hypothetical protein BIFGAL_04174 [Bifidobacterium gallicum DSM 20093 = LMG 11596]